MSINKELTCPLGSKCSEIKNDKLYECAWFVELKGTDAQGNDHDERACSIAWMPLLQIEVAGTNRGQTKAIESLRNEQVKGHGQFMNVIQKGVDSNAKRLTDNLNEQHKGLGGK